ncbi:MULTISPECIES: hypothetical protein [unclassified Tatumella]|uniref:hypothetical protein n=1 Tax=unclassified Tatumella TaxID=2649542 RepID=UPI001BAE680F|nr:MULTISPECIES: hypothetical protein [unclassified Tatumella]MBS0876520.1 hypothetical protein [Tatumella sp. JGM82]MBS0889693.1 hypothetical protein [Tatumella sp. JGM94]MBS0900815.1 hypothetical protein [Tatumella sp. JGM100]
MDNSQPHYFYIMDIIGTEAIKFGITNDPSVRLHQLNSNNFYKCEPLAVFTGSKSECERIERYLKKWIFHGYLGKNALRDGHTETTPEANIENIFENASNFLTYLDDYEFMYGDELREHINNKARVQRHRKNKQSYKDSFKNKK